jgi:hypothetical protein
VGSMPATVGKGEKRKQKAEGGAQEVAKKETRQDEERVCKDCGASFVFSVKEQRFNELKGFAAKARCADCVRSKKARFAETEDGDGKGGSKAGGKRPAQTRCFNCGKSGHVSAECSLPQGGTLPRSPQQRGRPSASTAESWATSPKTARCQRAAGATFAVKMGTAHATAVANRPRLILST